jgi:hypothetical protein
MRFVYATRPLPKLEFATANRREAVPDDAEVYAVCDGALTIRQQNEPALRALTIQEQSALQELIIESQMAEVAGISAVANSEDNLLRRLFGRLFNSLLQRLLNI